MLIQSYQGPPGKKIGGFFPFLFTILTPNPARMRRIRNKRGQKSSAGVWMDVGVEHWVHPWEISQSQSKRLRSHLSHSNPIPLLLSSFHNSKFDTRDQEFTQGSDCSVKNSEILPTPHIEVFLWKTEVLLNKETATKMDSNIRETWDSQAAITVII